MDKFLQGVGFDDLLFKLQFLLPLLHTLISSLLDLIVSKCDLFVHGGGGELIGLPVDAGFFVVRFLRFFDPDCLHVNIDLLKGQLESGGGHLSVGWLVMGGSVHICYP